MSSHNRTWPALDVGGLPPPDAPDAHDAVQGDLLEATLTDFDVEAIDETHTAGWRVFFRTRSGRDRAQQAAPRVMQSGGPRRRDPSSAQSGAEERQGSEQKKIARPGYTASLGALER